MSEATLLVRFCRFCVRALMCVQPARPVQKAGVPLGRDSTDILLTSPNLSDFCSALLLKLSPDLSSIHTLICTLSSNLPLNRPPGQAARGR